MIKGSIGIHVDRRVKNDLTASLEYAFREYDGMQCAQIFTHGPRAKARSKLDSDSVCALSAKYRIYQHTTYMTSWKGDDASNLHIQDQMTCAAELGLQGIVLHLAKEPPSAHIAVMQKIEQRKCGDKWCRFILEMRAVKPGKWSYQTADEINTLCSALQAAGYGHDRVWICLDTAHLAAGGIALRSAAAAEGYISALAYPEYVGLLHLNGNAYNPDERAGDCHCIPGSVDDWIWYKRASPREIEPPLLKDSGIAVLAKWFTCRGHDVILEQNDSAELVDFYRKLLTVL